MSFGVNTQKAGLFWMWANQKMFKKAHATITVMTVGHGIAGAQSITLQLTFLDKPSSNDKQLNNTSEA
jgi:hypothetical protein